MHMIRIALDSIFKQKMDNLGLTMKEKNKRTLLIDFV
jgi:hypothetical protein